MRIIGGHDYYDGLTTHSDKTRVFLRDRREVALPKPKVFHLKLSGLGGFDDVVSLEVIFCGRRYRGLSIRLHRNTVSEINYFWSATKLRDYIADHGCLRFIEAPKVRWHTRSASYLYEKDLDTFFSPAPIEAALLEWVVRERALVAIAPTQNHVKEWVINSDGLKDLWFYQAVAPWEAYQELEMFLGTILVGDEDRMVKVSDEIKLRKYGFDKWSFKNIVHAHKPRGHS